MPTPKTPGSRSALAAAVLCAALGCDPDLAASPDPDAGTEAQQCRRLSDDWTAFLSANRSPCEADEECALWGTIRTCECHGYYDGPFGPAIRRDALDEAAARFPIAAATACERTPSPFIGSGICDAWYERAVCVEGRCVAATLGGDPSDFGTCWPPSRIGVDAGVVPPPDAGTDASQAP